MIRKLFLIGCIILTTTAGISQTKKELKQLEKENAYKSNIALVKSKQFKFNAISTTTQNGKIIDLLNNTGTLTINGNTTKANLPYFGVVQIISRSGNEGVDFTNENTSYDIEYNDKKHKIVISFSAKQKAEIFNLRLTITGSNTADLYVTSSRRNSISYYGKVSKLEE